MRKWYQENHRKALELLVGFYKTATKKETITWSESVDEALCFGYPLGAKRQTGGYAAEKAGRTDILLRSRGLDKGDAVGEEVTSDEGRETRKK